MSSRTEYRTFAARTAATDRDFVRLLTALAIGGNVLLVVIDAWLLAAWPGRYGDAAIYVTAAVPMLLLHLRHVHWGLRGLRPPRGAWSLAVLVAVNAIGAYLIGSIWLMNFAWLAVSILLVIRRSVSLPLVALVLLSPLVLESASWYSPGGDETRPAAYVVLAIPWRAVTQYILIRLVAAIRQLEEARRSLQEGAVLRERQRIDAQLRSDVGPALARIVERGRKAAALAVNDASAAVEELRLLGADVRRALADARRVASGFRETSLRLELLAAQALLEAAGFTSELAVIGDIPLDAPGAPYRHLIRNVVDHALAQDQPTRVTLRVTRGLHGSVDIDLVAAPS